MGDTKPPMNFKELMALLITCPMLTASNYTMVNENESDFTCSQSMRNNRYAIKVRHLGADRVREARLQTLMSEFEHMRMKDS